MEITGIVKSILPQQTINGKNGEIIKYGFVVEWQDNGFTKKTCFEVMGADRYEKMQQNIVVGNNVTVGFDVTSREWNGRWFTTANCFRCASVVSKASIQAPQQPTPTPNAQVADANTQGSNRNPLPF